MAIPYGTADSMNLVQAAKTKLYNPSQFWAFNTAKYRALLSGDPTVIKYWYKHEAGTFFPDIYQLAELTRSFYYSDDFIENAEAFFGLIPMIADSIAKLVAGSGYTFDASPKPEWVERAKAILDDNDFDNELLLPSIRETVGIGDPAWHIHFNPELSDKPIIELVISERQEIERQSGRLVKHIVKQPVDLDNEPTRYELHTIYSKRRKQYEIAGGAKRWKDDGIRQEFKIWNGSKYVYEGRTNDVKTKIFEEYGVDKEVQILPLTEIPVIYLPNNLDKGKNTSLAGKGRPYGIVFGLDSISASLDEDLSNFTDTIRKCFPFLVIAEQMIPSDLKGNKDKGSFSTRRHSFVAPKNVTDADKLLQHIKAELNTSGFVEGAKFLIDIALNRTGINAATLGLQLTGHVEAEATQNAKERNSIRTRNTLAGDYQKYMEKLFTVILQYEDYADGNTIARNEKSGEEFTVVDEYKGIKVKFNPYIVNTPEEVTDVIAKKVQAGIMSTLAAVREQHEDWDDELVVKETNLILAEKTAGQVQLDVPGVEPGIQMIDDGEDDPDKPPDEDVTDDEESETDE